MINPNAAFPGKTAGVSAEYPYGKARDVASPGDGTGTPLRAAWVNDWFGFQQSLIFETGIVPTGIPDEVGASQSLDAVQMLAAYGPFTPTVALVSQGKYKVGATVRLADRGGALFVIMSGGTANGFDVIAAGSGKTASLVISKKEVELVWLGAASGSGATSQNNAVLARAAAMAEAQQLTIVLPPYDFHYSACPKLRIPALSVHGAGVDVSVMRYSGNGVAFDAIPTAAGGGFLYGVSLEGFSVDGGASATSVMGLHNIAHGRVSVLAWGGNGVVWDVGLGVLVHFDTSGVPLDKKPAGGWQEALRLGASIDGASTTACVFTNFIAEGGALAGIRLLAADHCQFTGGTSESNPGRGVLIAGGDICRGNSFDGLDMEANGQEDFLDSGTSTRWRNCLATSAAGAVIEGSSKNVAIEGGTFDKVSVLSGAKNPVVQDIVYNVKGTGSFTNGVGANLTVRNVVNHATGAKFNVIASPIGLSVGASPFAYTNNTDLHESIIINGGVVTGLKLTRDGVDAQLPAASPSSTLLAPGDTLTVTFTTSPTLARRYPYPMMR